MDNTNLFKFNFVDRTEERKQSREFFLSKQKNVLWVYGDAETGKTSFVKKISEENKIENTITVDFSSSKSTDTPGLVLLLEGIDQSKNSFVSFIKNNFSKILNVSARGIATCLTITSGLDFYTVLSYLVDSSVIFENNNGNQFCAEKVVSDFLLSKKFSSNSYIIFDHFEMCDKYSFKIISNIVSLVMEKDYKKLLKFIIITTDLQDQKQEYFSEFFAEEIPLFPIKISKLPKADYFSEMLFEIFDLTHDKDNFIEHVFNFCDGYPGRLEKLIQKMYLKNTSIIRDKIQ